MSCAQTENIEICRGKTFSKPIRWEEDFFRYAQITAITRGAPTTITAVAHGIPPKWRGAIVSVGGMTQLNASSTPPKAKDYRTLTVVDVDTIELNDVNSSAFKPYTSGGYIQHRAPVDLTNYTARLTVKDRIGGTPLLALTDVSGIVIDSATSTITIELDDTVTAALAWTKGVYDLELVSPTGVVTALIEGAITVSDEVTT